MKKEIIKEYTNEFKYNEGLKTIKNILANATCQIKEYKEYENRTKCFYGRIELIIEQDKLEEQDKEIIEIFELLEETGQL